MVAGDVVTYSFHGTNTGTVTLHGAAVTDPMAGLSAVTCAPAAPATLAPNATIDCTATYTVTQADVDAGAVANTATVSGLDPSNAPVSQTASATVSADQSASLALTKTATPASGVTAGDVVTYSFHGTNTGRVTLHGVTVTDPMGGLSAVACTPAAPATLAPDATIDCTATYTVTQADVDAGSITNTATVHGLTPGNDPVSQDAAATVNADQTASLSLTKTALPDAGVVAGDVVTFTIHGANTGTVTLHDVDVTDALPGVSALACTPSLPATLAPERDRRLHRDLHGHPGRRRRRWRRQRRDDQRPRPERRPRAPGRVRHGRRAPGVVARASPRPRRPTSGVTAGDVVTYTFTGTNTGTVTLHVVDDHRPDAGPVAADVHADVAGRTSHPTRP